MISDAYDIAARWLAAADDLATHPRHDLTPKDRRWINAERKRLRAAHVASLATLGPLFAALAAPAMGVTPVAEASPPDGSDLLNPPSSTTPIAGAEGGGG